MPRGSGASGVPHDPHASQAGLDISSRTDSRSLRLASIEKHFREVKKPMSERMGEPSEPVNSVSAIDLSCSCSTASGITNSSSLPLRRLPWLRPHCRPMAEWLSERNRA